MTTGPPRSWPEADLHLGAASGTAQRPHAAGLQRPFVPYRGGPPAGLRIILARVGSGDAADHVLLAGDFNAPPASPSRVLFSQAGLIPAAELVGGPVDEPTYQFYGIRWRSLDEIYASGGWRGIVRWVVDAKPGNTFPSDHFGVLADLLLRR